MYDFIKVMTAAFFMPLPFFLFLALLGLLVSFWRRWGLGFSFVALLCLGLVAWEPVADRLLGPIERQVVALSDEKVIDDLNFIVVLGAGWDARSDRPANLQLSESSILRLVEGLRLWTLNPEATLVVAGASRADEPPMAWGYRDMALDLGVPRSKIVVLDRPTDTGAEAREFAAWLGEQGAVDLSSVNVALVTSASHLPRALRHFEAVGLTAIPAPARFKTFSGNPSTLRYWMPSAMALRKSERAWYEFLAGRMVQLEH